MKSNLLIQGHSYTYNDEPHEYVGTGTHKTWGFTFYGFRSPPGRIYWLTGNEVDEFVSQSSESKCPESE